MPVTANEQTVDTVNVANLKTIAESLAAANAGLAQSVSVALGNMAQDMASASARRNNLADMAMAKAMKDLVELDPLQAVSAVKSLTGDDTAQKVLNILGSLAGGQQAGKQGDNSPPVTP